MKKFQIVSLAIVFVAMNVCCAQGGNDKEFEKNFKELTLGGALGNSIDLSQMGTSFAQIARGVVGADKAQAKPLEHHPILAILEMEAPNCLQSGYTVPARER